VLDLLTAFPQRAFKMSEIVEATGVNVASCHAVLNALTASGYLSRTARRTYVLGPALVAVGQAAVKAHPLIERAQRAAEELFEELRVSVFLSTLVGEDILVLSSIADPSALPLGVRAGQRQPAMAPLGAHLVAWSPEPAIEAWIAKAGAGDEALAREWRRSLGLIRQRGFQVTVHESETDSYAEMMAQMAASRSAHRYKDQTASFLSAHPLRFAQPEAIAPDESYDVNVIAAPIFGDEDTHLSLCLASFSERLTGAQITAYADRLMHACVRVMREHRAA
jgi:DNA-binding IclR family transcriptional regulator